VWHISRLDPGESIKISFEVRVKCPGELRNVAEVYYRNKDGSIAGFCRADAIMIAYSSPRAATHSTPSASRTGGVGESAPSSHYTQTQEEKGVSNLSQESKRTINESAGAVSSETSARRTTTSKSEVATGIEKPEDKRSKLENLHIVLAISIGAFLAILYASYYLRRRAQERRG